MPKIQIPNPSVNRFRGIFPGQFSGEIFLGKNIDLEKSKSKVQLADSFSALATSASVGFAALTTPVAFVRSSADGTDRWWANAGSLYKTTNTDPETGWALDAIGSSPTAALYDMIDFAGALIVPTSTNLSRLASGVWTASWWTSLTGASALSAAPHRFAIFEGALVVTDGRFINDYDGTIVRDPALTLPVGFEARWVKVWRDLLFIGGIDTVGREANVYTWRRTLTTYESAFPIGDTEALCCFVVDVPYIVTKKGAIKRFNGAGFELVQQFPTVELNKAITLIHPNGIAVQENIVRMLVNFGASADIRVLSGLWTFDASNNNLYHSGSVKNSIGADYAQHELVDVGAVTLTTPTQGSYLIGARPYVDYGASTSRYGIFSSDEENTSNRGYFITPKIPSADARNYWRYITAKVSRFQGAGDRLRVYFRQQESTTVPFDAPSYENITWVDTTHFTGSNSSVQAGDLVEVIAGDNAGALERITAIAAGSPNTYTIATAVYASTAVARARYIRANDIGNISSQSVEESRFIVGAKSNFCQFIFQLVGDEQSPKIERLLLEFDAVPL